MYSGEIMDVTIIGGGPAGLYSAFYSGLRGMKTKLIEVQPTLGGKLNVYPEKMIWDVGGVTPIRGARLMEQLIEQGLTFSPEVVLNEKIESITRDSTGRFVLEAASGRKHDSKTVIAAVGSGILNPQKLRIEGAERYEVTNLHYTVKSLGYFKGKTVLISGGGNTAVDWANELEPIAGKVMIAYRRDAFAGHEAQVTKLANSSVSCYPNTTITKLIAGATHEAIERVELTNRETGESAMLAVDEVIISHGYDQDTSLLRNSTLDIAVAEPYLIAGTARGETSVEGLFAAGDILKFDGKLNLIAGAFQDAANAVNQAKRFIEPDAEAFGMVSSHNHAFKERNRAFTGT